MPRPKGDPYPQIYRLAESIYGTFDARVEDLKLMDEEKFAIFVDAFEKLYLTELDDDDRGDLTTVGDFANHVVCRLW